MLLQIEHINKCFPAATGKGQRVALQDVSFTVGEGEFICLVGASGCGKSTLLNIIAGLTKADSGHVRLNGKPVTGPGRDRMVMFQEHALFPWLNVMDNVLFALRRKPGLTSAQRKELAEYYLKLVNLQDCHHARVHTLSGGMRQRVALARALAPEPNILLMDEPFAALDAMTREQLYADLQRICVQRGKTCLFVTHNVHEAAVLGDRVVLFAPQSGQIRHILDIDLPRPRTTNLPSIGEYASTITAYLKSFHSDNKTCETSSLLCSAL